MMRLHMLYMTVCLHKTHCRLAPWSHAGRLLQATVFTLYLSLQCWAHSENTSVTFHYQNQGKEHTLEESTWKHHPLKGGQSRLTLKITTLLFYSIREEDRNQCRMQGRFYMITDSANRQKSHFSQEMRRQRLVEVLQNDTYLPIREEIWDKEKRIASEETQGSKVFAERWGWGGEGESDGETYKGGRERKCAVFRLQESEGGRWCGVGNRLLLKKHTWVMKEKEGVQGEKGSVTQTNRKWVRVRESVRERGKKENVMEREHQTFFFFFTLRSWGRYQFRLKVNIRWKCHLHTGNLLSPA